MSLSLLQIESEDLRKQWRSCHVDPWLRVVLILTADLYQEQGAQFCRIVSLLGQGNDKYGRIAEVSVLGLPGVRRAFVGDFHKTPDWIARRINVLFPFGDGYKKTAIYNGATIRLEVPFCGYMKDCLALRDWFLWGAKRKNLRPRGISLIEPETVVEHASRS